MVNQINYKKTNQMRKAIFKIGRESLQNHAINFLIMCYYGKHSQEIMLIKSFDNCRAIKAKNGPLRAVRAAVLPISLAASARIANQTIDDTDSRLSPILSYKLSSCDRNFTQNSKARYPELKLNIGPDCNCSWWLPAYAALTKFSAIQLQKLRQALYLQEVF